MNPGIFTIFVLVMSLTLGRTRAPEIYFQQNPWHIGEYLLGETTTYEFPIKNIGIEPLIIDDIKVSCSKCMRIASYPKEIAPREESSIFIEFNFDEQKGRFKKQIFITANNGLLNYTLYVRAQILYPTFLIVPDKILIKASEIDYVEGGFFSKNVRIYRPTSAISKVIEANLDEMRNDIQLILATNPDSDYQTLTVKLKKAITNKGYLHAFITLKTDSSLEPEITIPIIIIP
ncbi:DUF1573 domain-containing protein [Candidatus Sumerlaeota bacterium]|nr:DUF1573 domain-containing protein [Candidatus Sumerlaeota bacterium]